MGASKNKNNKASSKTNKKPMNPLLILGGIVILLMAVFVGLLLLEQNSDKKALEKYNPYGTKNLQASTIDLLSDENYQNIILEGDLDKRIESGELTTTYFFGPTCQYCKATTPILMPLAEDMGIDIVQFNLLEYNQGWSKYNIEATPTLVVYKDGKEISRSVGQYGKAYFKNWLTENVINNK